MAQKLLIRDLTLRDGQQSSFATRMRQEEIDRVLPYYKQANFYALEVWGGAVPDSVMRYLNENPWDRLEKIKKGTGDASKLTALSRGRNVFGYAPYTNEVIEGFCRNAVESGLDIMRIFDALNDVNNVKSTIKYIKANGGMADCAVCYTIDPKYVDGKEHELVFTDDYFVEKAKQMAALGADMITIKDMSGLIPPKRIATMIQLIKKNINVPLDFHTHCTPGYGLGSALVAIINKVDILDTNIWNFAGGTGAPALELIYVFCKKLGVELDVDMEVVAKINKELHTIREELSDVDATKQFPIEFNPLTDKLPVVIDKLFDDAIEYAKAGKEDELLDVCHLIEGYFNFPKPNLLVKDAEIPGGMYSNMVAQLKTLNQLDIIEDAMKLIPEVRLAAGLPPLVTPTSQIVGAQAVNCALDVAAGKPMYTNVSNQFKNLVKGEYGETPVKIDPEFRKKITGSAEEMPYDTSKNETQPNPTIPEAGNVKLAENEKEELLLELFPLVAKKYLKDVKIAAYNKANGITEEKAEVKKAAPAEATQAPVSGNAIVTPMPGNITELKVKVGDTIKVGDTVAILEAMKMENNITSDFAGKIISISVKEGETVASDAVLMEVASANATTTTTVSAVTGKVVSTPMPGNIIEVKVKVGDKVKAGDSIMTLEAMKMENDITSDYSGTIKQVFVKEGETVASDAKLVEIA